ncbi:MAG: hypothetical protein IKB04_02205 [Clostridia bacterium]|nr:hypothetical protein [Clostridia bacterium]
MSYQVIKKYVAVLLSVILLFSVAIPSVGAETSAPEFPSIIINRGPAVETNLDFGGETFTYAHYGTTVSEQVQAKIDAFEQAYNVNINVVGVPTQSYIFNVYQKISNDTLQGKPCPIDIVHLDTLIFNEAIINYGTVKPLNNYVTTADLWDDETETGFSAGVMQQFSVHGNIYGVGGNREQPMYLFYYNKAMVETDPLTLYNNGQWTWEALYDILKNSQDTPNNVWGLNTLSPYYSVPLFASYGTRLITTNERGELVYNREDPKLAEAFAMLSKICSGDGKIANPDNQYESGIELFSSKKLVSVITAVYSYDTLKNSLGDDLGVIPLPSPYGTTATAEQHAYGASFATSDAGARCAVAFAKFMSANNNILATVQTMSEDVKQLCLNEMDKGTLFTPFFGIKQKRGNFDKTLLTNICAKVVNQGTPLETVLTSFEPVVNQTIADALVNDYDDIFVDLSPVVIGFEAIPKKTIYLKTETLSAQDIAANLLYADGTKKAVTDFTVSGYSTTLGVHAIIVSSGNYTDVFTVNVVNAKNGWIRENDKWYFYQNSVPAKNTWKKDYKGWCYVGADGAMMTNTWVRDSVGWCYVGADGYCVTNCWKKDSVGWCYLGSDGRMVTNKWLRDSVGWCYVGANGYCVTNKWMRDSVGWVYLNAEGRMATNRWVQDSVGWCYVGADGYAVTNCWKRDSVGWCYLNAQGSMLKNSWLKDGGKWYYLDANGYMVTGVHVIGGKPYAFNSAGVWIG